MTKRLHSFSQNFLRSPAIVKRLLSRAAITQHDVVYDIGAGSGVVTDALAGVAGSVVAVEIDPRMAAKLRQNVSAHKNVVVYQADFMSLPLPHTPYKVFANIPFSLSSQIVHRLMDAAYPPTAIYLIVQEQFARKLLPDNKGYTNQLGVIMGGQWAVRIVQRLQPSDFYPRPNVPTVLLEIVRRPVPLLPTSQLPMFTQLVEGAFADPRKLWRAPLREAGLPALAPPSRLTLEQWVALFMHMQAYPERRGLMLLPDAELSLQPATPLATNEYTAPSTRFVAGRLAELAHRHKRPIAAPRIGVSKQLIAVSDGSRGTLVLANPQVRGERITAQELNGQPITLQLPSKVFDAVKTEIALLRGASAQH